MSTPAKIFVNDLSGGWNPSVDAANAPQNVLLRADNLVFDEIGVARLRRGATKIHASAFGGSVNRMFTTVLNGQRVRMTGAGNSVYENGSLLSASGSGTGDFSFGSHMGQILATKGNLKVKWDGTTLRTWGIPTPASAPTVVADAGNATVIATCDNAEAWAADTGEGAAPTNIVGYNGEQAKQCNIDASSFRGVMSLAFAAKNLNNYSGEAGSDTDLIELYVKVTRSELLESLSIQFDANINSVYPFQDDYFQTILDMSAGVKVKLTPDQAVANLDVEAFERDRVRRNLRTQDGDTGDTGDGPISRIGRAASWVRVSVPRGKLERVGSTAGMGWNTICGVRIVAQFTAAGGLVGVDNITISGGEDHALTGAYQVRYIHVFNSGTYQGKSGLSPASNPVDTRAGGLTVTIPASTNTSVNETWIFVLGGGLNRFYRMGVMATNGGIARIGTAEATVATLNIVTENNSPPPDNIIGIVGPHTARTWALTPTKLYPSRRNNPDSFDATQAITVGDETETALWVVLTSEGALFVGTTKTIYSISGYGLEYPDGTTDFVRRSIQVEAPIDAGVATDGYAVFYMGSDGWRMFSGGTSQRIVGNLDLLYEGEGRYGINAVNLGSGHARFRCAFFSGRLFALSGEGIAGNDEYSPALHVFHAKSPTRERRLYPFNIVSLYREPDGGILAGCTDGFVREIEVGTTDDGALIPYEWWTPQYVGETPLNYKDPFGMEMHADTGNTTSTVALYTDAQITSLFSTTFASSVMEAIVRRIDSLTPFRRVQARVTGSANSYTVREFTFNYRLRPQRRLYVDTGYVDTGGNLNTWVRRIRIKARIKAALSVIAYFDDTAFGPFTVPASPVDKVTHFPVPMPKDYKGRQPRIVVYAADNTPVVPDPVVRGMRIDEFSAFPSVADLDTAERMRFATVGFAVGSGVADETDHSFECYWIELTYFPSGAEAEARVQRVAIG